MEHKCLYCGNSWENAEDLKNHIRVVHIETSGEDYEELPEELLIAGGVNQTKLK